MSRYTTPGVHRTVLNHSYMTILHERHPERNRSGVAADETTRACVNLASEHSERGRLRCWWVRSGIVNGTAFGGGCRYATKAAALEAYREAVDRSIEEERRFFPEKWITAGTVRQ